VQGADGRNEKKNEGCIRAVLRPMGDVKMRDVSLQKTEREASYKLKTQGELRVGAQWVGEVTVKGERGALV